MTEQDQELGTENCFFPLPELIYSSIMLLLNFKN